MTGDWSGLVDGSAGLSTEAAWVGGSEVVRVPLRQQMAQKDTGAAARGTQGEVSR